MIRTVASSKSPGPDGFTAEFLKCYVDEVSPLLLEMYKEATYFITGFNYSYFEKRQEPVWMQELLIDLSDSGGYQDTS